MSTKKDLELVYLQQFKEVFDGFPEGNIIESERPDFIVNNKSRKICIEVTRIYKSSSSNEPSLQAIEATRRKIAESARKICEERNIPHLTVSIHFSHDPELLKVRRNEVSEKIANIVCNNIPNPNTFHEIENNYEDPSTFPDCVHSINIGRFDVLERHHFNVPEAGWVQEDFSEELRKAIESKNQKLSQYNNDNNECTKHWLLIVAEGFSPSSLFNSSGNTRDVSFQSNFHRTFFIESFTRNYWEVKRGKAGKGDGSI